MQPAHFTFKKNNRCISPTDFFFKQAMSHIKDGNIFQKIYCFLKKKLYHPWSETRTLRVSVVCLLQSVTDWQTLFCLWFLMFQTSENPAVITARCFNIWHSRKCHTMRKFKGSLDEASLLNNMLSSNSCFRLPRRKYSTDILWPKYRNQRTPAY